MWRSTLFLRQRPRHVALLLSSPVVHHASRLSSRPSGGARLIVHRGCASISAAEMQFGQPIHETHPHILNHGELTPGITALEYAHRRSRLASRLPRDAIAVLAAADVKYRAPGIFYEYHQDPDFFYLTGFTEPGALAIVANDGSGDSHVFHLYVREKDPKAELWDGARSGTQAAMDIFNADETGDIERVRDILPAIMSNATEIYTDIKTVNSTQSALSRYLFGVSGDNEAITKLVDPEKFRPLRPILHELRVFKSESEVVNMRRAGRASGRAFTESMRKPFSTEKGLSAFLQYQFKAQGCDGSAFVPVVAGGRNALGIHYTRNDDILRDGQLVLVDGGGEYGGYISDITRTWPINGKFSAPQRDLYSVVLNVLRACVSLCGESAGLSLDRLHSIAENNLKEQLTQLGFDVTGDAMGLLFPHHLGHYIGLDVHDSAGYPRYVNLKAGQCITIEPGIYVPDDDRWPKSFRGIGIRLEDSVCVGDDSPVVLSAEAAKEVEDIEALRA